MRNNTTRCFLKDEEHLWVRSLAVPMRKSRQATEDNHACREGSSPGCHSEEDRQKEESISMQKNLLSIPAKWDPPALSPGEECGIRGRSLS